MEMLRLQHILRASSAGSWKPGSGAPRQPTAARHCSVCLTQVALEGP